MSEVKWTPEVYQIAGRFGPQAIKGHTYRSLGMHLESEGSPKGRRPPRWHLTHLGTGHLATAIEEGREMAFKIATEIAEAGDWDFESFGGMANRYPSAREDMERILASYGHKRISTGGGTDEEQARTIAAARY